MYHIKWIDIIIILFIIIIIILSLLLFVTQILKRIK